VVFRRDSKVDAFQRQMSALRQQLGGEHEEEFALVPTSPSDEGYRGALPDLRDITTGSTIQPYADPFPAEPAMLAPAPLPAVPTIDTQTTVIAHTTVWKGTLEAEGSLHVHGRVEGALVARDDIFVAEEAEVDASITASRVVIAGSVLGSVQCTERLELLPQGRISGDVRSPVLVVHEGAMMGGKVHMTAGHETKSSAPAVSARVAHGG
jgi:cytoskeletal protein CcmA (bactofilin family)